MAGSTYEDLPDRFGPMLVKELRQGLRRGSFIWPFLLLQLLSVLTVYLEFVNRSFFRDVEMVGLMSPELLFASGPFWFSVSLVAGVLIPLTGFTLMRQELDDGNHELLLLTELKRWRVVKGKFLVLWGLSGLACLSILPYALSRYMLGSVELYREVMTFLSVLGLAAVISAGAIGASAYRSMMGRILYAVLYLLSGLVSILISAAGALMQTGSTGILYHATMAASLVTWVVVGLMRARAQLKLYLFGYEAHPGGVLVGLLFLAPFLVGMLTLMTAGYAGILGQLALMFIVITVDQSPSIPPPRKGITPMGALPAAAAQEVASRSE